MNKTPILFLDVDDVLCMSEPYGGFDVIQVLKGQHPDPDAVFRELFHPRARAVLKSIHDALDGELSYVISSTWRTAMTRTQFATVLRHGGLEFVAEHLHPVWATSSGFQALMRIEDIEAWLDENHQGDPFAVVDDTFSGLSLKTASSIGSHCLYGRVVLCQESIGLLPEHVEPLVQALRRGTPSTTREVAQ